MSFTNVNENIQYIVLCMIVKYPIYSCYVNKFEFAGWHAVYTKVTTRQVFNLFY